MASFRMGVSHLLFICLLGASLTAPPVAADPIGSPPESLEGRYNITTNTVELHWSAPAAVGDFIYRVYRSGVLLDEQTDTAYVDELGPVKPYQEMHLYHVTAVDGAGSESGPSNSFILVGGPICEFVSTTLDTTRDPPVSMRYHEECVEPIWELIGHHPDELIPIDQRLLVSQG